MEQIIIKGEEVDKELSLAEMRKYLLEWYTDGIVEHISNFDEVHFEDYDKDLTIKDAKTEQPIFYAVFHRDFPINDQAKVYLSGVRDEELRALIGKCIELDDQIAKANAQNSKPVSQKGE